jgi:hypothetical protein
MTTAEKWKFAKTLNSNGPGSLENLVNTLDIVVKTFTKLKINFQYNKHISFLINIIFRQITKIAVAVWRRFNGYYRYFLIFSEISGMYVWYKLSSSMPVVSWSGSFRDLGHLVMGPLVMGRFVIWVLSWLGHFVMGHWVMGHFVMGRFVMGRFVCESEEDSTCS